MTLASLGLFILLRLNTKTKEINVAASSRPFDLSFDYVERCLRDAEEAVIVRAGGREFTGLQDAVIFDNVHWHTSRASRCPERVLPAPVRHADNGVGWRLVTD